MTLEATLTNVETIIKQMEASDVSLEEAFSLYQQGVMHIKECNRMLDEVEKKMLVLNQNGELEEF